MWDRVAAWNATWQALGACPNQRLHDAVIDAYCASHRSYHTLQHLAEYFARFDELRMQARYPAEIELAIWFHDAIYDVQRQDNEERSAAWANQAIMAAGLSESTRLLVSELILATRHLAPCDSIDAAILVDADVAILGASPERFDQYEQQIRVEYQQIPAAAFACKRRKILQDFLQRPSIFSTALFQSRYESRARANLVRALQQ